MHTRTLCAMLSGVTTDITAAHVMASGDLGQQLVVKSGSMCFGHANGTSPQDAAGVYPAVRPQPNDVALFLHTSGTTSKPKVLSFKQWYLIALRRLHLSMVLVVDNFEVGC